MAGISDIKAGKAYVEIGGEDSALAKALASAARKLQQWGSNVRATGLQVAGAGASIFTPLAGAGAAFAEHGEALKVSSQKTGLSVEATSTLGYAAQQTKTDFAALETGIMKMSKTLVKAAEGSKEAESALAQVGLTVADLNGLSQEDRLKKISDGLSKIEDPAARAAAAMGIFGRGGAELLPLLSEGSKGIEQMQNRARALGLQWSTEDAEAATKFSLTLKDMWDVLMHGVDVIGSAVAPALTRMATFVTTVAVAANGWVKEHKSLIATALVVSAVIMGIGTTLVVLGTAFSVVGIAVGTVASIFGLLVATVGAIVSPLGIAVASLLYFTNIGTTTGNALIAVFKAVYDSIKFVFENTSSLSAAWAAAQTEAGTYIMQAWANVKGYLVGLWIGFKGVMNNLWDDIGIMIVQGAYNASESFLTIWSKAMHAWNSMVNATARAIQDTFLATDKSEMEADLARIDRAEKSGHITKDQANQQRTTSHATYDGLEDRLYADRAKKNDDDLDQKLSAIKTESDARQATLADLRAKQKQATDAQTKEESDANKQNMDDAVAAAKAARKAYEDELKKAHDASGDASLADQFKKLTNPLSGLPSPKMPRENDLKDSLKDVAKASSIGSFSVQNSAQASQIFGGSGNAAAETAIHTKKLTELQTVALGYLQKMVKGVENGLGLKTT